MRTLELPIGYAQIEVDLGVDQSTWQMGLAHRASRRPPRRRWNVRWDGVGPGAQRYLEALFLEAGQGAAALEWTPPGAMDSVHVRMTTFEATEPSAADRMLSATLEEVLEPCSSE